ncbi:immunity protein Imm33 domain-containing protein [Sphingomonas faeni]|uniref:immunity protein Imm33 domain-containing protein n=1 Tax=Sphingomonas faeni TaxID=185950 RepID=UPI003EBC8F9B
MSEDALRGGFPLHGLRHSLESGTSGWFICSGEYSDHDVFSNLYMLVILPATVSPGWRFLVAPEYEDVRFDSSLLDA